ncbi:MAG: fibronectin type III domain-containing protein, partial [Propionibacteriaceae bacterium]|jgi:hypothetical protein|nr:fibronectin type III domain-containing protein [Propionibacteriaceae bacterium]
LNVEVGESSTLQLDRLVTNPEPTDTLTFNLVSESPLAGVKPSLTGSTLTVTVNPDVPRGTQLPVKVSVDDGHNPPVEAEITVKIVGSRRPLPQAVDDIIPDAVQGASRCVNVTANDMNPFPGKPLVVIGAVIETGAGGTAVPGCAGGAGVTVTPAPTFYGEMVIRYTIRDATGDPTREASARIYLNVRGRPDPPSGLHIDQVGDRQVILSWQPPNNNGAAITTYTVTSTPEAAGYPMRCETTTCVLSGLTNNVTYRFTVTATNGVGTSDPSLPSTEARPDAVPYRLEAPSINFGDKAVTLTWVPRGSPGSPVTSYDLQISPPPPSGQSIINAVGTGYTWTGLSNGTAYQVRVCARNLAVGVCDEDSHWSTFSIEMIPAGLPDPPGTPTWTRLNPVGSEAQVEVCWGEPYENGAPISSYLLRSSAGHTYTVSPTGGQTCRVTTLPTSQTDYTFDVAATNKAGQGGFSNSSAGFRAMTPPGPVTGASAADRDRSCQVTFTGAALNGARSSEVTYKWSTAGASGNFGTNTSGLATGLTNSGVAQTITLWATTTVQGVSQDGPTTTVSCNPYGPPNQPGVTAAKSTDPNSAVVYLTWTAPSPNGRSIVSTQVWVDGNDQGMQAASGSTSANGTWSQNHSIRVRVCDSTGQCAENTTSANANPSPKPPPSVTMWRTNTNCSHGSANCKLLAVKTANFSGNVTCQVVWTSVGLHDGWVPWVQGPDETKSGGQTDWPGLGVGVYAEIVCGGVSSTRVLVQ